MGKIRHAMAGARFSLVILVCGLIFLDEMHLSSFGLMGIVGTGSLVIMSGLTIMSRV